MTAYCTRVKLAMDQLRFTFDGTRIRADDCPRDHDIQDGDSIEVFQSQEGGLSGNLSS